jgi:4-carboxymuconolactone decarboxylase
MSGSRVERLPMPDERSLTAAHVEAVARITAGPRGALVGPFVPLLRSPELMDRLQMVGEYLRYGSLLDDDVFEVAVLAVARRWDQQFEWGHHQPLALTKGVPQTVVDDVERHRRPTGGRGEYALVWDVVESLLVAGGIDDAIFHRASAALGEQGVVELVVTVGYYTTLALVMNVAGTPSPGHAPRMSTPAGGGA